MLKEGYKHLSGVTETTFANIEAVKAIAQITRTSLGPNGMNKMVQNHLEKLFVTNDAATILKELDIVHPAAKIAVLACQAQEQEIGDGTNFVLVFIGELLQNAEALIRKGLHPSDVVTGFTKACDKALELLEKDLVVYKIEKLDDPDEVAKCLKSAIASKQYGYEDLLSRLIANACIQVLPKNPQNFNVDNVRVAKILGGGISDTTVLKGFVLTRDSEGTIKHVTNAKVAVFQSGFDAAKPETKDAVLLKTADELLNYNASEEKAIEELVRKISELGVKVIVSGASIGEMAMHFLERHKIMAVKCPSKFDLRRICKAIGAVPVVNLRAPTLEELGSADQVTVEEIGSTKVTIFRENKGSGIATIVIRASTTNTLDDLERVVDDGVNVFKAMTRDGSFVAGAGATEIELSKQLQAFGASTKGLSHYAIRKFAEAFEVIPRTLAENAGQKATEALARLYAAHDKGNKADGLDIETGEVKNAVDLQVLDLMQTKRWGIKFATDAAITILKIDQIIVAKRAGGPKPPAQGPMDAD